MTAPLELVIIGAGGHAREVVSYVRDLQRAGAAVELLGALDDGRPAGPWLDTEVLGPVAALPELNAQHPSLRWLTAFGSNQVRRDVVGRVEALAPGLPPWTLIHPTAYVGHDSVIGAGTLLAPGVVVTSGVSIGRHVIVNARASISHDCVIDDLVNVNPAATVCGTVRLGLGACIGAGATVIERRSVGGWAVVGAGAVVVRDVPGDVTAVGVPARVRPPGGQGP